MKRRFLTICIFVPCVLIIFSTCIKDVGKPAVAPVAAVVDSCKLNVTFSADIQPILNTYCAIPGGCHTTGASWGNFGVYGGFSPNASLAVTRVKNGEMPPAFTTGPKPLSACEITKLETWVNEGAQNN